MAPESSSSSAPSYHYVANCILRRSAVEHLVCGHLRSHSSHDVVFDKETSIELLFVDNDGVLHSICDQPLFGKIIDLAVLPRPGDSQDLLVALSGSWKLSFLNFCNDMHRFFPVKHVQLSNLGNTSDLHGRLLAVDSSGCCIATISAFKDRLALIPVSMTGIDIIDEMIIYTAESEETVATDTSSYRTSISGTIWSMCFVSRDSQQPSKEHNPVLAVVLNRRGESLNDLILLEWNIDGRTIVSSRYNKEKDEEKDKEKEKEKYKDEPLAHHIVEVPNSRGFAFLLRTGDVLLMDLRDASKPGRVCKTSLNVLHNAVKERTYVCSWSWEPDNNADARMIFSVATGQVLMIKTSVDSEDLKVNISHCLYNGLPCKAFLWVKGAYIAALLEMGDGVVLKLEDGKLCHTNHPIQNIAPVSDMTIVDNPEEKHGEMFACCCGVAPEGSLRIIRSGISVEKLMSTPPIHKGVTGVWTLRMNVTDSYHSFLILSFLNRTVVLSIGSTFTDVTDSVGFQQDVCTLTCGLIRDCLLAQIHCSAVRLCLPTKVAHSEGISFSSPICISWTRHPVNIILGAVGHNFIAVQTSDLYLFILGLRKLSAWDYEIYEMHCLKLENGLSCISIPRQITEQNQPSSSVSANRSTSNQFFLTGTRRHTLEIWSCDHTGVAVVACTTISLTDTMGTTIIDCAPQDVRLVFLDKYYVVAGLRNGMLLRFEWQTGPSPSLPLNVVDSANSVTSACDKKDDIDSTLELISIHHISDRPVSLVPLDDTLDPYIIALSERPWLLHSAGRSLFCNSISFQPSIYVTPVCSVEFPKGILFVAGESLHLVEMVHIKRLSAQKFHLEGTPQKVLYHNESKMLLVMRKELKSLSDICCVDPLSGSVLSSFRFKPGERGESMQLVRAGSEQVLVVGTSVSSGHSSGAVSAKGRLLVLRLVHVQNSDSGSRTSCSKAGSSSQQTSQSHEIVADAPKQLSSSSPGSSPDDNSFVGPKLDENEAWQFQLAFSKDQNQMVLAVCPYLDRYFLASAGKYLRVLGFMNDNPGIVRQFARAKAPSNVTSLTAHSTRIAVGDCEEGILFYSYNEDARKLKLLYSDPLQRLATDCILMDAETAIVSDRAGSIVVLCPRRLTDFCSKRYPILGNQRCILSVISAYFMAEVATSVKKASYSYKVPADDALQEGNGSKTNVDSLQNAIIASTRLGSIMILIPLSRDEYEILEAVQVRLAMHKVTAPILGNDHNEFRNRENLVGAPRILDGDMLTPFLELTRMQQQTILSFGPPSGIGQPRLNPLLPHVTVDQVVQLLKRVELDTPMRALRF